MTYSARGDAWAKRVVAGKVPANRRIVQACERHLSDLKRRGPPWKFDRAAADRVCEFTEACVHIKGEWARGPAPYIRLEDWQCWVVCSLFGWKVKRTGRRRFRRALLFLPRKNAKSTMGATTGLYMAFADGEPGAEVYSGATNERQAWEVFGPARTMAQKAPGLAADLGVAVNAKTLVQVGSGSRFEPVIGKPGDGSSPHCAIVDEYHEHATSQQYDTFDTGMGARSQPLLLVATTAGDNLAGPCKGLHDYACKVLDGVIQDDAFFCALWELGPDDGDWTDFENWRKCNPNMGVSVGEDFLRGQHAVALQDVSRQNVVRTKHLNQWVSTRSPFFNVLEWQACRAAVSMDQFAGRQCWIGVDLASKVDLAALVVVFRTTPPATVDADGHVDQPKPVYTVFARHYLPEDTLQKPENQHYRTWQIEGRLIVTDGAVTDFRVIEDDLTSICSRFQVREVAYDPFQATEFSTRMAADGVPMVEVRATVLALSEPMKECEALVKTGRLQHDGDPVLVWEASNVVAKRDQKDNVYPCKERPEQKIDGVVALLMALSRAMVAVDEPPKAWAFKAI
jgi:phage terminase large subunit-like protein